MGPTAAVIVAGGAGRRLGGADKPELRIGDRTLLQIALEAVGSADTVVVGPERAVPVGVRQAREQPPGGGPAAALAAGVLELRPAADALVAVLAADQPGVTAALLTRLSEQARLRRTGVVAVDPGGRRQYLLGVFPAGPLLARCAAAQWSGRRLGDLLDPLIGAELPVGADEAADIDTPQDLDRWRS